MVKISVVIPTFNEERYIVRCLESLLKQSYKYFEIIIVDDGSTDTTTELLGLYSNIRIYEQDHQGPGAARNLGAKKANGKILILVDADMEFHKDFIKNLIKPIKGKVIGTFHSKELVANIDNIWARCWSIDRMPNPPKYCGVFRAVLKKEFLKSGGFDSSKGYFDDDLSKLGLALRADGAILSHNNPETLGEVFRHSAWVGNSLNRTYIISHLKRYISSVILMFIAFLLALFSFIFLIKEKRLLFLSLNIMIPYLTIVYMITIKRVIEEKYPKYLIFMPIFLTVKFAGYVRGFISNKNC